MEQIGVSVYDVSEARRVLQYPSYALLQLPFNLLDSRWRDAHVLEACRAKNIVVLARSVFLQGLFSLNPAELPSQFDFLRRPLADLHRIADEYGSSPMRIALPFALAQPEIQYVIIGVDTAEQLDQNLTMIDLPLPPGLSERLQASFHELDAFVVEPRQWPTSN